MTENIPVVRKGAIPPWNRRACAPALRVRLPRAFSTWTSPSAARGASPRSGRASSRRSRCSQGALSSRPP
eukprot:8599716-Pyramimonas_sp.AAC.1